MSVIIVRLSTLLVSRISKDVLALFDGLDESIRIHIYNDTRLTSNDLKKHSQHVLWQLTHIINYLENDGKKTHYIHFQDTIDLSQFTDELIQFTRDIKRTIMHPVQIAYGGPLNPDLLNVFKKMRNDFPYLSVNLGRLSVVEWMNYQNFAELFSQNDTLKEMNEDLNHAILKSEASLQSRGQSLSASSHRLQEDLSWLHSMPLTSLTQPQPSVTGLPLHTSMTQNFDNSVPMNPNHQWAASLESSVGPQFSFALASASRGSPTFYQQQSLVGEVQHPPTHKNPAAVSDMSSLTNKPFRRPSLEYVEGFEGVLDELPPLDFTVLLDGFKP